MPKIPGTLIVDLHPSGKVRLNFITMMGEGYASPVKAADLDAAEVLFMTCGLSEERAAALRSELERYGIASVELIIEEEVAEKFRYSKP